ncbi:MAG: aminotransferase class I/II-fold pyridoxal phosphate-dependent enzyme [Termitinemataceae bacterium]|nr:MAG: aminotransferase class I/II-fold pyridoxal phosphate-dependent enzyme [Termitinemataceae bacterium]
MDNLASGLNDILDTCVAGRLLSKLGRRLYFPRGIIAQSAEAKKDAYFANATIGMAYQVGRPLMLSAFTRLMPTLTSAEMVAYAPTAGIPEVRELWKAQIIEKNPSLEPNSISLPVVVPGITAGISYIADLFLDEGGDFLSGTPAWDNYRLIFEGRRGGNLIEIPFFNTESAKNGLDIENITVKIRQEAQKGAIRLILNFPNNPSGYSPTVAEQDALVDCIVGAAEGGCDVLVVSDDAYFGLFYEADTCKESVFSRLCSAHERILAVKADGPTKEDYSWGFRLAMLTFGSKGMNSAQFDALTTKTMGAIRSSVSCSNTPSQSFLIKTYKDEKTNAEKAELFDLLKLRYLAVKKIVGENENHPVLQALPFNSGYFMSFLCKGVDAETLRLELLKKHGIGTVSIDEKYLRVAFSALESFDVDKVFKIIYQTARDLVGFAA